MATAPSTYSFPVPIPTTVPMYATTTHLPPHPYGFGAPPYAPYHHSVAAYAPPPFSSYPAPASGVFLTPAYDAPPCSPPSTPCSTPFPFGSSPDHAYGHGFISTQASQTAYCPNQPPPLPVPATSEFSGDLSSWSPLCSRPILQQQKDSPTTSWPEPSPALDLEKSKTSAEAQVRAEASISKNMPRAVLDLKRRLDELQARDRTSVDNLQGELAKLTSMASQLAISLSKHSTSPHTSTPAASAAAPASAVSQVFGEIPTPNFLQETHGTDPRNCSRHHNPIQNSGVSNNISEQNLDIMPQPQQYDFPNPTRRTVFRADGSDQSYFTLPADYLLERVPMPVFDQGDETKDCSQVFVEVPASSPEKQTKSDNAQFAGCVNNVTDYAFHDNATAIHVPHFSVGESIECSRSNKIELTSLPHSEPCGKYVKEHRIGGNSACLNTSPPLIAKKERVFRPLPDSLAILLSQYC